MNNGLLTVFEAEFKVKILGDKAMITVFKWLECRGSFITCRSVWAHFSICRRVERKETECIVMQKTFHREYPCFSPSHAEYSLQITTGSLSSRPHHTSINIPHSCHCARLFMDKLAIVRTATDCKGVPSASRNVSYLSVWNVVAWPHRKSCIGPFRVETVGPRRDGLPIGVMEDRNQTCTQKRDQSCPTRVTFQSDSAERQHEPETGIQQIPLWNANVGWRRHRIWMRLPLRCNSCSFVTALQHW